MRVAFNCHRCGQAAADKPSHYARKQKHFCSQDCYTAYKRTIPPEQHPRWQGGVSNTEAHRRWKAKNPRRMAHLKAARYARERGASGSHTLEQWEALKAEHDHKCIGCGETKPLTRDHIIPLALGGSHDIENIQPLCRNCNSRKWMKLNIYENPELITK